MTIVANFATDSFAFMVADKRRINIENLNEKYDDLVKVKKINNNILTGISGHYKYAEQIVNAASMDINSKDSIEKMSYICSSYARNFCADSRFNPNEDNFTIHISGISKNGKIGIAKISTSNGYCPKVEEIEPHDYIKWNCSYANYDPTKWLQNNYSGNNLEAIIKLAINLIKHVSSQDDFVSNNYDYIYVKIE